MDDLINGNSNLAPSWDSPENQEWSVSKIHLVELIYALHSREAMNNGAISIKELVMLFETILEVDLGDIYRSWKDIQLRENPTKFLDELKESLLKRLSEED